MARTVGATGKASILQAQPLRSPLMLMVGNNLPCPPTKGFKAPNGFEVSPFPQGMSWLKVDVWGISGLAGGTALGEEGCVYT